MTEANEIPREEEEPASSPSRDLADLGSGPVLFVSSLFLLLEIGAALVVARTSLPATLDRALAGSLTIESIVTIIEIGLVVALLAFEHVHPVAAGIRFGTIPRGLVLGAAIWGLTQLAIAIVAIGRHGNMSLYVGWIDPAAMVAPFLERFLTDVFAEEIFWHGIFFIWILRSLERREWKDPITRLGFALLSSQFLFGLTRLPGQVLAHGASGVPPGVSLVIFTVTGMFWALIYLRTGNLWLVMIAHALSMWPLPVLAFDLDPSKLTVLVSSIFLIRTRAGHPELPGGLGTFRRDRQAGTQPTGRSA